MTIQPLTFERFEEALGPFERTGTGLRGYCPLCDQQTLLIKIYGPNEWEPTCESCRADPRKIRDMARGVLAGPPEPEPLPPKNGARSEPRVRSKTEAPKEADQPPPRRSVEIYSAADLVQQDLPEPEEIVPGFIYEGFNLFAGKGKTGKSWYSLDLAIAIAAGGRAFGTIPVKQGDVLYLALEDTQRRMKKRLLRRLQEAEAPRELFIAHDWPRIGEGCLGGIRKWLDQHPAARLVIVDVLKKVKPKGQVSRGVYDDDFDFVGYLKEIADEYAVALLGVTHTRKAEAVDVFDEVNASSGLTGAADAIVVWRRARGEDTARLSITGRDVEEEKADETAIVLQWHKLLGSWTILGTAGEVDMSTERGRILNLLRNAPEPLSPHEIAGALEKNAVTTRRLIGMMLEDGEVWRAGRGKYRAPLDVPNEESEGFDEQPA